MEISTQRAAGENRLSDLNAVGPYGKLRAHHAGEYAATSECSAPRTRKRNLGKESGLCDANIGVGGDEVLFRLANVRPSIDQGRRQTRGNAGRKRLRHQGKSATNIRGIIAEQNADGIFLLAYLSLQVRDLRIGGVEHLLSLEHVQLGSHAVIEAQRSQFY